MKIEPARAEKLLEKTISVSLHRNELGTVGLFNVEDVKTFLKSAGIEPNIGSHVHEIKLPIQVFKEIFEAHGFQNVRAVFVTDPWKGNSFEIKATKPAIPARVLPVKLGKRNREFLMSHNICLPL
jgi:hypothetical protein